MKTNPFNPKHIPFSEDYLQRLIDKVNQLYVMTRYKYLSMYTDKRDNQTKWNTMKNTLTDYRIKKHLMQENTIGVFSGEVLSKFICFDIDSYSVSNSQYLVHILLHVLQEDLHVSKKDIHISFSGKKGYHVEIFFNEALNLEILRNFHTVVTKIMSERYDFVGEVEFRPNHTQGIKIPMSIHHETKEVCWFVDRDTLKPIEDYDYLLSIEPIDVEEFKSKVLDSIAYDTYQNNYFTMEHTPAEETESLVNEVKPHNKSNTDFTAEVMEMIHENRLLRSHSRHDSTLKLAIYYKSTDVSYINAYGSIKGILHNTWHKYRELISKDTTYDYMIAELERVLYHVYDKEYRSNPKTYRLYKQELLQILELPNKTLRKLMFSLYIHSKKYARKDEQFFMAYSVMTSMGNDTKRSRLLEQLMKLEEFGYVTVIKRNATDKAQTLLANKQSEGKVTKISETNVYAVTLEEVDTKKEPYIEVEFITEISIYEATTSLLTENEVQKKLPKYQFYREYKPLF